MAEHNDIGRIGEDLAEKYLIDRGYEIICRNWTHAKKELDIVASKGEKLHFIEVKTRRSNKFGLPEEAVTEFKVNFIAAAAEEFLHQHPEWRHIQFNVLSISLHAKGEPEYFLIEDVYF